MHSSVKKEVPCFPLNVILKSGFLLDKFHLKGIEASAHIYFHVSFSLLGMQLQTPNHIISKSQILFFSIEQ